MNKLLIFFAFISMLACSPARVTTDFDGSANFAGYKTYAFTKEAEELPVNDINRNRVLQAISSELTKEGFTKSDKPDVWIDLKVLKKEKESATATTTSPYGAGYGYRWGGGFSTTTINVEKYVEGTLFVDMIDVSKKQLVWQGRAVGVLDPNASAEKRETNINTVIEQIFTKYPPVK
jgi:hypothetical protein